MASREQAKAASWQVATHSMSHCHHERVHCIASTKYLQEDMNYAELMALADWNQYTFI